MAVISLDILTELGAEQVLKLDLISDHRKLFAVSMVSSMRGATVRTIYVIGSSTNEVEAKVAKLAPDAPSVLVEEVREGDRIPICRVFVRADVLFLSPVPFGGRQHD